MLTIVGQGLAGTLVGLAAEKRGQSFRVIDAGSGATASRAAAGLFNPLTGPRLSPDRQGWDQIVPFYEDIEQRLGVGILHRTTLVRPLKKGLRPPYPLESPGWKAELCPPDDRSVRIEGGGWVDVSLLLDAARARWLSRGIVEDRRFESGEGLPGQVVWCRGISDFFSPEWGSVSGVSGSWQAVRGDVLTIDIPNFELNYGEIASRFLIPLGKNRFRWGSTHEIDVSDMDFRPAALEVLERELSEHLRGRRFDRISHHWGVRPASRTLAPLVVQHPDRTEWTLFNGFGGRGVSSIPRNLWRLGY